jgi:hypothetical protein
VYLIQFVLHMESINSLSRFRFLLGVVIVLACVLPAAGQAAPPLQEGTPGTPTETPLATLAETPAGTPEDTPTATPDGVPLVTTPSPTLSGPTPPTLTPSPGFSPTPTETLVPTPTATLEPLPEITLLFPIFTPTGTATPAPEPADLAATQAAQAAADREPLPRQVQWVGFVIVLLWLLLAAFLILFIRYYGR